MGHSLIDIAYSVNIDGKEYKINTDFRVWMKIEHLFFDGRMNTEQRLAEALILAYPVLPPNPGSAIDGIIWFYSAGQSEYHKNMTKKSEQPYYDLIEDFDLVWGSFMSEFGIDLTCERIHWWKFRALLTALSENCKFLKVVGYRSMDLSLIKDKQTKEFYTKMKKRFGLSLFKDKRTQEERLTGELAAFF